MPENEPVSVTIAGKQYVLAPLKLKHLKQITRILATPNGDLVARLQAWNPFIEYSIKEGGSPGFDVNILDELTMQELYEVWAKVQLAGGIKVGPKGETRPVAESQTGDLSTAGSQ
jgi:hypothetical protein